MASQQPMPVVVAKKLRLHASVAGLASAPRFAPLDFAVAAGAALSLRGASGAGKSSVLAALAGLLPCAPGTLWLLGEDAASFSDAQAAWHRRVHLGILRQDDDNLLPGLTVADNVTLQARLAGEAPVAARLDAALHALALAPLAQRRAGGLSGGECARVAMARIVYQAPALVLADEPTAAQDSARRQRVAAALTALRDAGSAVVLATHDAALADALGPSLQLEAPT